MPYKLELSGLEVMAHAPEAHPTNFQYRKPNIPPAATPVSVSTVDFFILIDPYFLVAILYYFNLVIHSLNFSYFDLNFYP